MYKGLGRKEREDKRRGFYQLWKRWRAAGALALALGTGAVFVFAAGKVMAAPEDPEVEARAEAAAADSRESVSGNEGIAEMPEKTPGIPLIVVDPGHGGMDDGCSDKGVFEKDINLEIAERVQEKLTELGYQAVLAREDDTYIAKEERVQRANAMEADAYISIHQNTFESSDVQGIEAWYYGADTSRDSKRLARLVYKETLRTTGAAVRELREDAQFCVTGQTEMPACLIETGFLSNPGEKELLMGEAYREQIAEGIASGVDLYFRPKTMYLTFDDGPSEENTSAVLDVLKERNIKATFFVVGENVREHPEVARRIVEEGHTIGIHCNVHDYEQVYESAESYAQDFEEAYRAVYEVTGAEAKLFRFPGGSINAYNQNVYKEIIQEMTARGFVYYDWNASLEDAVRKTEPEELVASAQETALGRKKVVLLAHDIVYNTALCLDDLIDGFPEYRMEPLTPEVEPVQFKQD